MRIRLLEEVGREVELLQTMQDDDSNNDLMPREAREVFLWQYRRDVLYANAGQKKHARRAWNRALRHDPNHPEARTYLKRLADMD